MLFDFLGVRLRDVLSSDRRVLFDENGVPSIFNLSEVAKREQLTILRQYLLDCRSERLLRRSLYDVLLGVQEAQADEDEGSKITCFHNTLGEIFRKPGGHCLSMLARARGFDV